MSAIALELHEVLEQEYVRTGGEVLPPPDDPITEEDVLDWDSAAGIFQIEKREVVNYLEERRKGVSGGPGPLKIRNAAQKLTPATQRLLQSYDRADDLTRRRINRRMLEEILEDALRGAKAWPEITADQILDVSTCCSLFAGSGLAGLDADATAIAARLESLRRCTDPNDSLCPAKCFASSPTLECNTRLLIANYPDLDTPTRMTVNRRILDDVFGGSTLRWRDVRLGRILAELHKRKDDKARTALCISGGGIRSATFALGVMQGLASRGLLKRFDYLSTVSGGGYIGGWLSSWVRRHPRGIEGVERDLAAIDSVDSRPAADDMSRLQPEAKPIRHLREYGNYLTPRLGMTSGDTWSFGALYLRNLIVNLLILVRFSRLSSPSREHRHGSFGTSLKCRC